jgi:hypothetical protein
MTDKLLTPDELHAELIERLKDPTLTGGESDAFRAGIAGGIAYAMAVMNGTDLPMMAKAFMSSQLVQELCKLHEATQ